MNEKVLAVPRSSIESFLQHGFFEPAAAADVLGILAEHAVFLDRPAAEEDPSHKQIIPYIVVSHKGRFLLYRRTKKQGESRLHNKVSLGFGGHINDIDCNGSSDTNLILAAMVRELNEELYVPSVRSVRVVGFINDDTNPVGQVHLGVAFMVDAWNSHFAVNEPDKIEAKWADADEVEASFQHLESWSQLLWTQHIRPQLPQSSEREATPVILPGAALA